jgi:hypothetical protein
MEVEVTGLFLAGLVRTPALPDLFVGLKRATDMYILTFFSFYYYYRLFI